MQLLFGVAGPEPAAAPRFERLRALTEESNPGLELQLDSLPGIRVGHHLRSFARFEQGDLPAILLDGEVREIDGRETTARGRSEPELAQIAELYRRHGPATWERLEGSFCLIVRDGDRIRIGLDVGGTRAVYWWAADGLVAFHSNLLDLAPVQPGSLAMDEGPVGSFLAHSYYPLDRTAFEGIRRLCAGQVLEIEPAGDGVTAHARYHFRFVAASERRDRPIEVLADELNDLLQAAIARSWRSATRPVVPLSGGVDSRYLAASLVRIAGDPAAVPTITWGEDPTRPDSDAIVAARVAAALGTPHTWYDKPQVHRLETLDRAIYLTSGEGDGAINFPNNHEFHERLVAERGFGAHFRGDQAFGEAPPFLTRRGVDAASGLSRIRLDPVYPVLLGPGLARSMADAQDEILDAWLGGTRSPTPQARLYEIKFESTFGRETLPYNTLKHQDCEVYLPLLERRTLDWVAELPDHRRSGKRAFRLALDRLFPDLAPIPFATRDNLPLWDRAATTNPAVSAWLRAVVERPGWLDSIDAKARVMAALDELQAEAVRNQATMRAPSATAEQRASAGVAMRERLRGLARDIARETVPGRLVREWTMARRAVSDRTTYDRLSRLAIVHALVGHATARQASQARHPEP